MKKPPPQVVVLICKFFTCNLCLSIHFIQSIFLKRNIMKNELETTDYNIIEQDSNIAKSNSTTLTIGMLLDGMYEIRREIARGGMGIVYEAYHKVFNKKVAIKIILPITIDSLQLKRFQKEVRAYSNLSHPNIIHIYNVGIYENTPYIVMDYIDGVNICQYVAQHDENYRKQKLHNAELGIKRDWKLCVKLIYETALALEYIHKQKMIHRDIKPSNIIVRSDGTPIIIDLGLVKFQSEKFTNLTQSGELLGTLSYMPIEQAQGKHGKIDARSDIYSLGLVLYELLTGEMAYSGENILEISYKIMSYYPPLPRKINPQIPEALEKITMHAIDKKKEKRYATAQEFADELKKYLYDENAQEIRKNNDYKKQVRLQWDKKRIIACCIALVFIIIATISISASPISSDELYKKGLQYEEGNGVTQDYKKAFKYFQKAANKGHAEAQCSLGSLYYWGRGVEQDHKKSFYWFEKSANQGNARGQCSLGFMYHNGYGIEKNDKQAIYWYEKSANQGNARGQCRLGNIYYFGRIEKKNDKKAFCLYEKSANQDYAEAQCRLGVMYHHGYGVKKDYKQAIYWYEKAAKQDYARASYHLGNIYFNGIKKDSQKTVYEVNIDYPKALDWYEKAANQGDIDAQYKAGIMCDDHKYYGVKGTSDKAIKYLELAANKDHAQAQIRLGGIYLNNKAKRDYQKALYWFEQSANQGHADGQYYLGVMYSNGYNVVKKDLKKAYEWLEKASKQGHTKAKKLLNELKKNTNK